MSRTPKSAITDGRVFLMPKYTKDFKIKLVMEYLSDKSTRNVLWRRV